MAALSVAGLSRDFGAVRALEDVSLSIGGGEVVAIVGENGAGKSTLLDVLSGVLAPSAGRVTLGDEPFAPDGYRAANLRGVWRIFQDPALIPAVAVFENLLLGHEKRFTRAGMLDRRSMVREAQRLVTEMGLDVDVRKPVSAYDTATRQALEVARASLLPRLLGLPAGFVLFDEPTTGLTRAEVDRLLELMRAQRAAGVGVAFVSHRLDEVFAVSDRIYVLKDGRLVAETTPAEATEGDLHRLMVGRERLTDFYCRDRRSVPGDPVLAADGLGLEKPRERGSRQRRRTFSDVSLQMRAGEVVGIGGLLGSGKADLLRALAGVHQATSGTLRLGGTPLEGAVARRKRRGVAFVSGDRGEESVFRGLSVAANVALASGEADEHGFSTRTGRWRTGAERREARRLIGDYGVKATARSTVGHLSGGNQQKVALARWTRRSPRVLLVENPTAGVDVGAKQEIYRLLRELAATGAVVLFVSDELPELIGFADRVLVLRDGRLVREFATDDEPGEHELVAAMVGGTSAEAVEEVAA